MDVTRMFKKVGGRGSGRGSRGGGGGRGRGRGRGGGQFSAKKGIPVVELDDEDEICNMAFEVAEMDNNSLTKSFETLNAATELDGFDPMTGCIWIYPTNRPVRDYQYEIVKTAMFNNTLVSLPTGLGKTFISAVVMYNYQRWYPTGIIVFMAPTRPLVTQQLEACHNTVGISPAKTVELTGQIAPKRRQQLWQTKTVFFLTPQVFLSDLERKFFPPENVRCIVVDEAHKALGNHAYVQVISKISATNRLFRVLALSATPGSDIVAVKQVFKNLLIARVELRSEDSLDLLPYIHEKKVEKIVVKIDDYLKGAHDQLLEVFQIYSGKLMKAGALTGRDGTSYAKFQLLKARETFRKDMATKMPNYQKGYIEVDFAICISLAHAIEILLSHGLRTFYIFLHGVLNKEKGTPAVTAELRKNTCIQNLLDEIKQKLNISVENSTFDFDLSTTNLFTTIGSPKANIPNKSFIQEDIDYTLSHPKLKVLRDIVHRHFLDYQFKNATTRVMIFSQYRDSVQEIGNMLNSLRPMVKPMVFIGQANTSTVGRGLKQKDQVQVVQQFRDGGFNVLVSTSVGEEGLDIGEVDLIVCFDASKSPTRLIQRMGRTGRQREGRTVFLLTQGKEERSYTSSISSHSSISKSITDPNKLQPFLYKQSPRMVPVGIDPVCYKMSIILSTELSSQLEPMQLDLDDEDSNDEPGKAKGTVKKNTKKKATAGKKKKNEPAGSSKKANQKGTSIAKLFDRMHKATPPPSSGDQQMNENASKNDPVYDANYVDDYGMDEGMHMFVDNDIKAFNKLSIYPKIFDITRPDRLDWKACTTFVKNKLPPSSTVCNNSALMEKMECLVLDGKDLAAVEYGVKSRESFSYLKTDFCGCGNAIEPHEAERDKTCYKVIKESAILDQPVIDEEFEEEIPPEFEKEMPPEFDKEIPTEFEEEIPPEFFEDFFPPTPPEVLHKSQARIPPPKATVSKMVLPTTPLKEDSSDDDTRSQFSASPEVGQNRFLEKLREIKLAKNASSVRHAVSARKDKPQVTLSSPADDVDLELTSVQNISTKKFKFKKKTLHAEYQKNKDHEEMNERKSMSPSPPLSPILNLSSVSVTNDLFKDPNMSPSPQRPASAAQRSDHLDLLSEYKSRDRLSMKKDSVNSSTTNPTAVSKPARDRKPVKFLKPPTNVPPPPVDVFDIDDDILEEAYRTAFENPSPPSSTSAKGSTVFKFRKPSTVKSIGGFHTSNLQPSTSVQSPTEKETLPRHRPSLKVVQPTVWKYSSNDVSHSGSQQERRPIVRNDPLLDRVALVIAHNTTTTNATESRKFVNNNSGRDKFSKSPSVSSTSVVSSTTSYTMRPTRNILSRNRPKKPVTTVTTASTSSSSGVTISKNPPSVFNVDAPLTPPRTGDTKHSDDSDSPDFFTGRKVPFIPTYIAPSRKSGMGRTSESREKSAPITPVSSRRSENQNRFRISASVPSPHINASSPKTPTQLRYSKSRESSIYSCSPVSPNMSVVSSKSADSPFVIERQNLAKRNRRKGKVNPFIESQALVSEGDESDGTFGDENEFEFEGLDDLDDSFVTHEDDTGVTDSQQVMYLESVKNAIPARFGRIEKPLSPKNYGDGGLDTTGESYEDDSFCQDDVEYMDVGVFTQAMNQARMDLAVSNSGRQTRRGKREAIAAKNSESSSVPKQRRRIVTMDDDSSDDDDDFK